MASYSVICCINNINQIPPITTIKKPTKKRYIKLTIKNLIVILKAFIQFWSIKSKKFNIQTKVLTR